MCPHIGKLSCLKIVSVCIVNLGHRLAKLHDIDLGGKLEIKGLQNIGSLSEAREANLMDKKDLDELCLSWLHKDSFVKTLLLVLIKYLKCFTSYKSQELENIFL